MLLNSPERDSVVTNVQLYQKKEGKLNYDGKENSCWEIDKFIYSSNLTTSGVVFESDDLR